MDEPGDSSYNVVKQRHITKLRASNRHTRVFELTGSLMPTSNTQPTQETTTELLLNGQPFSRFAGGSIADLTALLELPARQFAVEVNEVLIPREQHAAHQLKSGDRVEIVTLVGGG